MLQSIMNISAYASLHRVLQKQQDEMYGIADQELEDILKYDIFGKVMNYSSALPFSGSWG